MSVRERPVDRGRRVARIALRQVCQDARLARVAAGLSQRELGRVVGRSASWVARVESGQNESLDLADLRALLAGVGLDPRQASAPRLEVPLPNPGDRRAWDALLRGAGVRIGVEAETGPRDGQALQRRLSLKRRDGLVDHLVLVLSDTQRNRRFLREYGPSLRTDRPLGHRALATSLRQGLDPGGSGILVL
ncbi:MAG: helix-turn-helix domain-containing protein [Chloroflexota bacterium]|nr:helix-turn-helix domain-containing protein [Chloroflexota bacterium]